MDASEYNLGTLESDIEVPSKPQRTIRVGTYRQMTFGMKDVTQSLSAEEIQ